MWFITDFPLNETISLLLLGFYTGIEPLN